MDLGDKGEHAGEGAGRVQDTLNLLDRAGRKLVACLADLMDAPYDG
ncbi:MAG TPA: hypothetical protein VGC79_05300 [Polyangiaceae bacterium]